MKQLLTLGLALFLAACAGSRPVSDATLPSTVPAPVAQAAPPASAFDPAAVAPVEAGAFDNGRMWTFEYPPLDYLRTTYKRDFDAAWFEKARLGAVRIPGCSGSFVSAEGLVMTNHHCARENVTAVSREGENLLDNGFVAATRADERPIPDTWVDRLVEITDVTDRVMDGMVPGLASEDEAVIIETNSEALIEETYERLGEREKYEVQVIGLFNGGRYSLYVFRRYTDVRLVMAPELQLGYFGGDPDNFTFPRYNLDMSFYRVYDENGQALDTRGQYFPWSTRGAADGEPVFLIGNPGSTTRQQTLAQLLYRGQVGDRLMHGLFGSLIASMETFLAADPVEAEKVDIRNQIFGLANTEKLYGGQIEALLDPELLGRRRSNEIAFRNALAADAELMRTYGPSLERMQAIQDEKAAHAALYYSWLAVYPGSSYAAVSLQRAFFAYAYHHYKNLGVPAENLEDLRQQLMALENLPASYERALLVDRLHYVMENLGPDNSLVVAGFGGKTPEELADAILQGPFNNQDAFNRLIMGDLSAVQDAAWTLAAAFAVPVLEGQQAYQMLAEEENGVQNTLGRAWFAIYGTTRPPDATFSLRISDGVVSAYDYNGTQAPWYTTFYGLYDRNRSFSNAHPWDLPARWTTPAAGLDLGTPLNFVTTNDIIGGNSGSPVVNADLEVVGLAFDSNIEGMGSNDFIFDTERARCVAVDVRGMLAALRHVYKAEALVAELTARK